MEYIPVKGEVELETEALEDNVATNVTETSAVKGEAATAIDPPAIINETPVETQSLAETQTLTDTLAETQTVTDTLAETQTLPQSVEETGEADRAHTVAESTRDAERLTKGEVIRDEESASAKLPVMRREEETKPVGEGAVTKGDAANRHKSKHTSKEVMIYGAMSCPINRLMTSYETNPFEFVPSRFLSLLPHPLKPMVEGAVMTCLEDIELFGNAEKLIQSVPAALVSRASQPATLKAAAPTARRLLSDQVLDSFTHAAKLSNAAMLQACDKPNNVTVTKVLSVFPDQLLINNQYAAAQASENVTVEPHSFMVVSSNTQHCCLYQQAKPPPDGPKLGKHDLYGKPQEMVTVQITASQAPKRWLCLRRSADETRKSFVTEIGGKRVAIQRDRGLSAEHNSALHLKVDRKARNA